MSVFDADQEEIAVFEFNTRYLFNKYFDDDFHQKAKKYYNSYKYWFGIPEGSPAKVRQLLDNYFCDLSIVNNIGAYSVVEQENTDIFLMKDKLSTKLLVVQEHPGAKTRTQAEWDTVEESMDRSGTKGYRNDSYKCLAHGYLR